MGGGHLAHAAPELRRDARVDPFLCPLLRRLGTGRFGSVGARDARTASSSSAVSSPSWSWLHWRFTCRSTPWSICSRLLGGQEPAPFTIAGMSWPADTRPFRFSPRVRRRRSGRAPLGAETRLSSMDTAKREPAKPAISLLLGWEKRKRREATLTAALFYAFLAALAVPLFVSLAAGLGWALPAAIFAVLTPCLLFTRRWRDAIPRGRWPRSTGRCVWTSARPPRGSSCGATKRRAVALLVLRQASEMLEELRCAGALPALVGLARLAAAAASALWLAMLHFDTRFELERAAPRHASSLAREAREFARELQQKAQSERFAEDAGGCPRAGKDRATRHRRRDRGRSSSRASSPACGKKMAAERSGSGAGAVRPWRKQARARRSQGGARSGARIVRSGRRRSASLAGASRRFEPVEKTTGLATGRRTRDEPRRAEGARRQAGAGRQPRSSTGARSRKRRSI